MTSDYTERVKQIIKISNLSPSDFAKKIAVKTPSIHHLLNNRNKPSIDLLNKICDAYPEIDPIWILRGEGSPPSMNYLENKNKENTLPFVREEEEKKVKETGNEITDKKISPLKEEEKNKSIEKVILLFTDGSFKEYS
ncbi:helix-turn-helix domain-containing protein [Ichthyobacterium seriolicida]|uniref:DNA-binding protein n=1 Tax=Ichthyobacterium seriolicida TaxID=242600 RepID=A0A1J1DZ60_9FLAO|nr:helix-turn-helix transcriptional regulator [Ichthyobacterium seriolicida]BAV95177.1 DNA-binding protein [Ichthyobacterium seriolicida]